MEKELFIGSKKIRAIMDIPDNPDDVKITFKDNTDIVIKRKLYNVIVREVKGNGESVQAVANAYVASKIVKELAEYGYERYQIEGLAGAIGNIVHNLTEQKIGEKFGVNGSDNIKLSDIL
jgi:hypothetical protein